jgi:hypothetical protein
MCHLVLAAALLTLCTSCRTRPELETAAEPHDRAPGIEEASVTNGPDGTGDDPPPAKSALPREASQAQAAVEDGSSGNAAEARRSLSDAPVEAPNPKPDQAARACSSAADCSWWQERDPALQCCAGSCANTRDDRVNCGACGTLCPSGSTCSNGQCRPAGAACANVACTVGQICCSDVCVDPSQLRVDCGGCGIACALVGASCRAGVCCVSAAARDAGPLCQSMVRCPQGQVRCGGACILLDNDPYNCGTCNQACPASAPRCMAGVCRL